MLPSELKNDLYSKSLLKSSNCTTLTFLLSLLSIPATSFPAKVAAGSAAGIAEAAAAAAAAAAAEGAPAAELLDHEAATICATPMLLQFLRALVLSWRTKLGGNLRIREDMPAPDKKGVVPWRAELDRPWLGWSALEEESERHSKDEATKSLGHGQEETAMRWRSLVSLWLH